MASSPPPKMTPQEFAQKIKAEYPMYSKVDDFTLAKKMLTKYPQYQDHVTKPGFETVGRNLAELPGQIAGAAESSLPFIGGVGGGIAGAGAGFVAGGPVGSIAGGIAGSGLGASAGEALKEKIQGKPLSAGNIAGQGLTYAALDAVGGPIASIAGKGIEKLATAIPGVKGALSAAEDAKILQMVSPRLTPNVAAETKVTPPTGIMAKISAIPSKFTKEVATAVKGIVNPAKTFSENASAVTKSIVQKAETLKTDLEKSGKTYVFQTFEKYLKNNTEIPHFIKTGDKTTRNKATSIIDKFMEFARDAEKNPDHVSSLLDARKKFDVWVKKEYPRVFDESGNAVNVLIKNIRNTANNFIAESVPDVAVKDSLKQQQLLYEAEDVLSEKAAKGELQKAGEIGSNRLTRFAARHPVATKAAGIGAAIAGIGAVGGAAIKGAEMLIP